ncbi:MAG: DUF1848 domain-containing protein [Clostridiales bacterium]|jgi:hypothetical protein|nr:DUF1848 domain-containing protein [Clostridiales bacterium]
MIISASRRTDIPCYYPEWLLGRLREGFVYTRNPFNHSQVKPVPLTAQSVDCIVFWTKDPEGIMPHLQEIDHMGFKYYFLFTLTPYDGRIEKNLRNKRDIVSTFIELSRMIGSEKVIWRYDPIIINDFIDMEYHKRHFSQLAQKLCRYTKKVIISFVDIYPKLKTAIIKPVEEEVAAGLAEFFGKTARELGLEAAACCENIELSSFGIKKSSCVDKSLIERICGRTLDLKPDKNQRNGCGCMTSTDIGAYNTCAGGCIYCYANHSEKAVQKNMERHRPGSEILAGCLTSEEKAAAKPAF